MDKMNPFLPRLNYSLKDVRTILDHMDHPCLIWDKEHDKVIQVNKQWTLMTSFNIEDLIDLKLSNLVLEFNNENQFSGDYLIKTKDEETILCSINCSVLADDKNLLLIILQPTEKLVKITSNSNEIAKFIEPITTFNVKKGLESFTQEIFDLFGKIYDFDTAGFYLGDGAGYLALIGLSDQSEIFPARINNNEIDFNNSLDFWKINDRAVNEIQRFAKLKKISFFTQINLNMINDQKGLLFFCFRNKIFNKTDFILFPILSAIILERLNKVLEYQIHRKNNNDLPFKESYVINMLENIKEGILIINQARKIIQCNSKVQEIFGFQKWEIINENIDRILPGIDDKLRISAKNMGTAHWIGEINRRDGSILYADIISFDFRLLNDDDIKNNHSAIIIDDLSLLKTLELEKSHLIQQAEMGVLVASFAHDVRSVFNSIQLIAESAQLESSDKSQLNEKMANIKEECQEVNLLMESVLSYSASFEQNKKPIDIFFLLERILERWNPKLQKLNIKSILQSEENFAEILGDSRSLEQVFNNLISNAKDAMSHKGGSLGVYLHNKEVQENQSVVEIQISDTGDGIPEELVSKIFDPYFSTRPGGTGLGLAISRKIIEKHQGEITVESFPGGTTFKIQFPVFPDKKREKR